MHGGERVVQQESDAVLARRLIPSPVASGCLSLASGHLSIVLGERGGGERRRGGVPSRQQRPRHGPPAEVRHPHVRVERPAHAGVRSGPSVLIPVDQHAQLRPQAHAHQSPPGVHHREAVVRRLGQQTQHPRTSLGLGDARYGGRHQIPRGEQRELPRWFAREVGDVIVSVEVHVIHAVLLQPRRHRVADHDGDDDAKDEGDPAGPLDHDDDERYGRSEHASEHRRRADERVQSGLNVPRLGQEFAEAEPEGTAAAGAEEYARHEDPARNRRAVRGDHHDEVKPAARA